MLDDRRGSTKKNENPKRLKDYESKDINDGKKKDK